MKYLCLVYLSAEKWSACPDSACAAYAGQLKDSGHMLDGTPLHPVHTATTVRVRNGQATVTDGPFAETKEAIGGFYLIDCASKAEAVEWASKLPLREEGYIEVRPIWEM